MIKRLAEVIFFFTSRHTKKAALNFPSSSKTWVTRLSVHVSRTVRGFLAAVETDPVQLFFFSHFAFEWLEVFGREF